MDVKLGRRVWDDFAEQDKIDRKKEISRSGDYRVPDHWNEGMRVSEWEHYHGLLSISRYWNGNIEELSMTNKNNPSLAVSKFFHNSSEQRTDVLHLMLDRLNNVYLRWFENQTAFKLFATSLLLVYKGDCSQPISPKNNALSLN